MTAHTCINDRFDRAPAKRVLKGDKKVKTEPGTHIIEFPGGAIELTRLEDNSYWAHIIVSKGQFGEPVGTVVDSRIDWGERRLQNIPSLPDGASLTQIAVLIRPEVPA